MASAYDYRLFYISMNFNPYGRMFIYHGFGTYLK